MARLTTREMELLRNWAKVSPAREEDGRILRALDELEEHRAREGQRDGVAALGGGGREIRKALDQAVWESDGSIHVFSEALALLPPKREPTLLEAAKAALDVLCAESDAARTLRSAIAREEGKQ